MATPLTDEGLQNWVKAWMAQKCFKEGILPFIKQHTENQFKDNRSHVKRVSKIPEYTCNTCDVKTIKPYHANLPTCVYPKGRTTCACKDPAKIQCPQNGSCGILYDLLKDKHSHLNPNWLNSRSQFWSSSAWEQMKCFIYTPGYEMQGDIEDADVTALVQICTNNKDLKALFAGVELGFIIQIREDRNDLCHSCSMNVDTKQLKEYVDHIKTALQVNALKVFPEVLTQSGMLDKLLKEHITKGDEIESRREVLRAIDKFRKELEERHAQDGSDIQAEIGRLRDLYDKHSRIINGHLNVMMEYVADCKKEVQAFGNDMSANMRDTRTALTNIQTTVQQTSAKTDDILIGIAHLRRLLETDRNRNPTDVHLPDLRVVVTASTQTAEQATEIDNLLVETGNCVLQNTSPATVQSKDLIPFVQHAFDEIGKVGDIRSVKKECMAVYINFPTLEKFMHFMEMYFKGSLSELFQPVQDYLREFTNCADITLNLNINEEDTVRSLILIQEQLNNSQAGIDAGPLDIEGRDPVHSYQDRTKDTETQCQQEQLNNSQAGIDAGPLDIEGRDPVHSYQDRTKDTETQCQRKHVISEAETTCVQKQLDLTESKRLQVIMAEQPSQSMSPEDSANASQSTPSTVPPPVPYYYHTCNAGHAYTIIIIMIIIIIIIINNMPPGPYQTSTIPPGQVGMFSSPIPQPFVYPYDHTGLQMQVPPGIGQTVIQMQGTPEYFLATRQQAAIDPSDSSAVNAVQKGLHSVKDRDIIIDAFGQIIQNAESMKKKSEETRSSYLTLQTEVQSMAKEIDAALAQKELEEGQGANVESFNFDGESRWNKNQGLCYAQEEELVLYKNNITMVARTQWDAESPKEHAYMRMPVSHVFVHHTVMNECFSQRECAKEMRNIQHLHQVENGWADIGYNFVIGQDGGVYMGRGWDRVGAHTLGWNNVSISFAFTGNFNEKLPTDDALNALEAALFVGVKLGKLTPDFKLHGHRDARPTESPGQKLYDLIRKHEHYESI